MTLNDSGVVFHPEEHRYFLGDKELRGITGYLSTILFPGKYDMVPAEVLRRAAEKGHLIHAKCELFDLFGIGDALTPEVGHYRSILEKYDLRHSASEYIVTDGAHIASAIDKVYDDLTIADIKTTYTLDYNYVQWQLSIYAYLFERQNPNLKVKRLAAIWLRPEKGKFVEIARLPNESVAEFLECAVTGKAVPFSLLPTTNSTQVPDGIMQIEQTLVDLEAEVKRLTELRKEMCKGILSQMEKYDVDKWQTQRVRLTRKKEYVSMKFNTKAFSEAHPDLYAQFLEEIPIASSLTLKIL